LGGPEQFLPVNIRLRQGISNNGKVMRYFLNFSNGVQKFNYNFNNGTDVLTKNNFAKGDELTLQPWDLAIIEEK